MRCRICLSCPADAETPKAPTGFRRCPLLFRGGAQAIGFFAYSAEARDALPNLSELSC